MTPIDSVSRPAPVGMVLGIAVTVLCWAFLLHGAGTGMDIWAMTALRLPPHQDTLMMASEWSAAHTVRMGIMWWAMMLAMMLPGMIVAFALRWTPGHLTFDLLIAYAIGWLAFSVLATGLQCVFEAAGWLDPMRMWSVSARLSTSLIGLVAASQTLVIVRTLRQASTAPKQGPPSATRYAGRCLMSTGPVMLLLFVGGAMNLVWILGLSVWAILQKSRLHPIVAPAIVIGVCLVVGVNIYLKSMS